MSHELLGDLFYAFREPGWHHLGHVSQERMKAMEALAKFRMDFDINLRPTMVEVAEGMIVPMDKVAIVRDPVEADDQYRILGVVGKDYHVMQNRDVCRLIDPLTEGWPVETMGVLRQGADFFVTLDAGGFSVKGDDIHQYFCIAEQRDGSHALDVMFTPVRVVCANTLSMGKTAAIATGAVTHTGQMENELEWRMTLIKEMQKTKDKALATLEVLADAVFKEPVSRKVIEAAYPLPRQPRKLEAKKSGVALPAGLAAAVRGAERDYEANKARIEERRTLAWHLFQKFNADQPALANTGWAVYNGVVEAEDYRKAAGQESETNALVSALFGDRARTKARAYDAALEYAIVR
jgi:phage/plasmid-like protein (TIGR03299 family)